jgi:hypothetical protein
MVSQQRLKFFLGAARPADGAGTKLHSDGQIVAAVPSRPINRKRHEADVFSRPGWTLDGCALVAARRAAGTLP